MADVFLIIMILIVIGIFVGIAIYYFINLKAKTKLEPSPFADKVVNYSGIYPEIKGGIELYCIFSDDGKRVLEVFYPTGLAPDINTLEKPKVIEPVEIALPIEKREKVPSEDPKYLNQVILYPLNQEVIKRLNVKDKEMKKKLIEEVKEQNVFRVIMDAKQEELSRIKELTESWGGGEMTDIQVQGIVALAKELVKLKPEEKKGVEKKDGEIK